MSDINLIGQITARTGHYRYLIVAGFGIWSVAQGLESTIDEYSSVGKICGLLLMGGVASGFTFQTCVITVLENITRVLTALSSSLLAAQAAVPRHEMAVVTGVRNFVRLFGSTIALAICASIINNELRSAIAPLGLSSDIISVLQNDPTSINDPAQLNLTSHQKAVIVAGYTKGFHSVFYLTTACCVIAFLSALLLIDQLELNRADDQDLKRQTKEAMLQKKLAKQREKDLEAGIVDSPEKESGDVADMNNLHYSNEAHEDS